MASGSENSAEEQSPQKLRLMVLPGGQRGKRALALTRVGVGVAEHLGLALGHLDLVDLGLEVVRLGRVHAAARRAVADDAVVVVVVVQLEADGT